MLFPLTDAPAVGYRVVEPSPHRDVGGAAAVPLPVDRHDVIAQAILRALPLSEHHRDQLRARGFTDEAIGLAGYRTWPREGRARLVRDLLDRGISAEVLARFPGYATREGERGRYATFKGAVGLLIPVRDLEGRIVAFRIRPDQAGEGGKYRWLSSRCADRPDAPSPGTPLHVAHPRWAEVPFDPTTVWITEGELKANLSADLLGAVVLSVPGVSVRAGVVDTLHALAARHGQSPLAGGSPVSRVVIAFDADKGTKPQVATAELSLARELRQAGFEVLEAKWPLAAGKGLDDLLVGGGRADVVPFRFPREGRVEGISREEHSRWLARTVPPAPPSLPLDQARARLAEEVRSLVAAPAPGLTLIEASPGVGKTVGALIEVQASIAREATTGKASLLGGRRVLFFADNHAQIRELLANPLLVDLARIARVRHGRTNDEASPGFCADRQDGVGQGVASVLAGKRHSVSASYCSGPSGRGGERCPFADRCSRGGYLAHLADLEDAPVVFATKGLLASDPAELDAFDVVIVDEDLAGGLFERVRITRQDVDDWRAVAARANWQGQVAGGQGPLGGWFAILHEVLVNRLPAAGWESLPLVPSLLDAARALGQDLDQVVTRVAALRPDALGRLPFERPIIEGGEWTVPLRATADLVEVVREDLAAWHRQLAGWDAPSRARLTRDGIELVLPRRRHIEALAGKAVVNLDATPCLPLLAPLFPGLRRMRLSVPERIEVTQVTNALYTPSHVAKDLPRLSRLVDALTKDERAPVVFSAKRFDPGAADGEDRLAVSNERTRFGHFDGESRGLDRYADASVLVILGHYVHNVGDLEALVHAARAGTRSAAAWQGQVAGPPPERVATGASAAEVLIPYGWTDIDGTGRARWVRRHVDPDVAALVEWSRTSNILQTIGRGRAALRPEGDPLRVVLLAGHPIPEVPLTRLTTVREMEEELGLRGARTTAASLVEANARREEGLHAKVCTAAEVSGRRGADVTPSGVARELRDGGAGGSRRQRIAEHLAGREVLNHPPLSRPTCSVRSKGLGGDSPPGGLSLLLLLMGRSRGRSVRPTWVGRPDRLFVARGQLHIRGPPWTEPSQLQGIRCEVPREERLAG